MSEQKDNTKVQIKRLSDNLDYYNSVFKRTEKIVSVVFYILSHINQKDSIESHLSLIKEKGLLTHEVSLKTLMLQGHEIDDGLRSLQYALLGLESTLRVAEAARVIPTDIFSMLVEQIDGVQRYVQNHYLKDSGIDTGVLAIEPRMNKRPTSSPSVNRVSRPRKVQIPAGDISSDAYFVYSQLTDRAERIKTVLEAKPQATIKDIAEIITDVSEKTIQRELNSLIEKGQVIRQGERRWSRYSVSK